MGQTEKHLLQLEEATYLGSVRTEQVKRTAKELVRRFPDKFTKDFEGNKRVVGALIQGNTTRIRNQIAGYITHHFVQEETETPKEEPQEGNNE